MATKYAKARNVAFEWRSEYKTVKRENTSLRRVFLHARALSDHLSGKPSTKTLEQLHKALKDSMRNAVFAVGGE